MRGELRDERVERSGRARHHQQPARVTIQTVHDAGAVQITHRCKFGIAREQPANQRPGRVPCARMHDEPGRLVDHDHVVVVVHDGDRDVGFGPGRRVGFGFGQQLDDLARMQTAALADFTPVDEDRALLDEGLDVGPAPARQHRHDTIDAFAVECGRNRQRLGCGHSAGARRDRQINKIAPIVMQESATLNTGNHPTETKSTTWPRRKPGARKMRSTRLPSAPASTRTYPSDLSRS